MRVLVFGGTGAIGKDLIQLLSEKDMQITVTSRKWRESKGNIKYIQGDAKDDNFVESIITGDWDAIVDFMIYSTDAFQKRVKLLLSSTLQYVFISSARVYNNADGLIVEHTPLLNDSSDDEVFLKTNDYALRKARQEKILHESGYDNWTVVRPYITYNSNRLQLGVLEKEEWLYRAMHNRTIVFSKEMMSKVSTLTSGYDVSRGIVALIGEREALGEAFHIALPDNHSKSWEEILEIYLKVIEDSLGYRPKVLIQETNKFMEFRSSNPNYQMIYDRFFNRAFDSSKIGRFIPVDSFIEPEKGLKQSVEEFMKKPNFKNIGWRFEAIKDKQTGERTPLREIGTIKNILKYLIFRYIR